MRVKTQYVFLSVISTRLFSFNLLSHFYHKAVISSKKLILGKCCHHVLITSLLLLWMITEGNGCSAPEAFAESSFGDTLRSGFFVFKIT